MVYRKISCPCQEMNPVRPASSPSVNRLSHPHSRGRERKKHEGVSHDKQWVLRCLTDRTCVERKIRPPSPARHQMKLHNAIDSVQPRQSMWKLIWVMTPCYSHAGGYTDVSEEHISSVFKVAYRCHNQEEHTIWIFTTAKISQLINVQTEMSDFPVRGDSSFWIKHGVSTTYVHSFKHETRQN
jgi:hypothetical protein